MTDISKCKGNHCTIKKYCQRYTCEPNKDYQSYTKFYELPKPCSMFISNGKKPLTKEEKRIKQDKIMEVSLSVIEDFTGIDREDILSRSRYWQFVQARQLLCYTLKEQGFKLVEIGRRIGRHHSTVIHALQTAQDMVFRGEITERELYSLPRRAKEILRKQKQSEKTMPNGTVISLEDVSMQFALQFFQKEGRTLDEVIRIFEQQYSEKDIKKTIPALVTEQWGILMDNDAEFNKRDQGNKELTKWGII